MFAFQGKNLCVVVQNPRLTYYCDSMVWEGDLNKRMLRLDNVTTMYGIEYPFVWLSPYMNFLVLQRPLQRSEVSEPD